MVFVGKFFGEIDGMVMEMLVKSEIYKQVHVVDYQATCFHPVSRSSLANILLSVIIQLLPAIFMG